MNAITPHIIIEDQRIASLISKDYEITNSNGLYIVHKNIEVPDENISQESTDALTEKVREAFKDLNNIEEAITPAHALVRKNIRGRLKNQKPTGYIVELSDKGPVVYSLENLDSLPLLGGYGSLLDPNELALNTEEGDLRNQNLSQEQKEKLAEKRNIPNKLSYAQISDLELTFNRAPTASRYGSSQQERNNWSVLNSRSKQGAKAYIVIFDPETLTEDAKSYFARENFDEMEYARRKINPKDITLLTDSNLDLERGLWVLDSPLITDVEGQLQTMIPIKGANVSDKYASMINRGLVQAEKISPGFKDNYLENTIQSNGKPLSENKKFQK
jgi:hypothetical protein